ncbi:MAG: tRNA uridine-5-carboxymethylaminomethyl(34) synthesis GTPase MnmE [Bacteroidales bacterium]|nr:tRNA uridine-5-carboxymethylaminomethyl(34) synthesis GTPase MnmE [Bacteroidales bacterium]
MSTHPNLDTICAISTPPGMGGIAVIRISGPHSLEIADTIWKGKRLADANSHTAHLGTIFDPEKHSEPLDQAVATIFRAPASFTGDDVVELSVHGSTYIQSELVNLLIRQGCRLAEPGEFTRRAFTAGKMDLTEAEGVADVIAATSRASHRVAMSQMRGAFSGKLNELREQLIELGALLELELDFSEEEVEFADRDNLRRLAQTTLDTVRQLADSFAAGDAIRRGIPVAIVGKPNVGKSSLLNVLLGDNRAIVSNIPGTTRDTIEDTTVINGHTYRFIDTAGLRQTTDTVENLGIDRAWEKIAQASLIIWVITPDTPIGELDDFHSELRTAMSPEAHLLTVINKTDLHTRATIHPLSDHLRTLSDSPVIPLSLLSDTPANLLSTLRDTIAAIAAPSDTSDAIIITNSRHYEALHNAISPLKRVVTALSPTPYPIPSDLIAQDIREAIHHLSTITGSITTPDLLSTIFSRFCIGK